MNMSLRYDFSSQRSFSPFPKTVLPEGFCYPEGYLEHSRDMLYPLQFRWWFIDSSEEFGYFTLKVAHERQIDWSACGGEIYPIPFARDGEIAAFFDGNDHSGDPPVLIVHLPDNICVANYDNFDAWLAAARAESGLGEPPYDKITSDPTYPAAVEHVDGYYFCPNCYEPNEPVKTYDEAIRCVNCETLFNI